MTAIVKLKWSSASTASMVCFLRLADRRWSSWGTHVLDTHVEIRIRGQTAENNILDSGTTELYK